MTVRIDTGLGDVVPVSAVRTGSVSDTWQATFGTYTSPDVANAATATDAGNGKVTVSLLVGNGHYNPVSGSYWLWINRNGADWENTLQRYVITNAAGTTIGQAINFDVAGSAAAVLASSLQKTANLTDIGSASAARTALGLGTAATQPSTAFDAAGVAAAAVAAAAVTNAATYAALAGATFTATPTVNGDQLATLKKARGAAVGAALILGG